MLQENEDRLAPQLLVVVIKIELQRSNRGWLDLILPAVFRV